MSQPLCHGYIRVSIAGADLPGQDHTLFDSTGLAIQDLAAARVALERARELGLGIELPLG